MVDRYAFSGVAFSSVKAGLSMEWCRQPDVGLPKPDLVCFLYADPEVLKNRGDYGAERYEEENFQKAVAKRWGDEHPTQLIPCLTSTTRLNGIMICILYFLLSDTQNSRTIPGYGSMQLGVRKKSLRS